MKSERTRLFGVYVRGIAMGAADVVPGVSGGTIAFITGIYEELLCSIKSINITALKILFIQGPTACWKHINGSFLLPLLLGILTSVLSFAHIISYLLEAFPQLLWSFFFGLICASSVFIGKQINRWSVSAVFIFLFGVVTAYIIGQVRPSDLEPSLLILFGAGAISICAMILPGISGSFILVLLGLYSHVLTAVK
ncbi:MAG: putative membrane protein, partial [Oceanicoccus sp.]